MLHRSCYPDPSTVENFMLAIKGGLASSRLDIVRDAYRLILTKSGNPKQFLRTAKTLYNPLAHPRVRSGESSTDRILQEFLAYWTSGTVKTLDGTVELIEWEYYYAGISQTIERDDSFEKLMLECWPGLLRESAGVTIPDGYSVAGKYKRLLASKVKRLEALGTSVLHCSRLKSEDLHTEFSERFENISQCTRSLHDAQPTTTVSTLSATTVHPCLPPDTHMGIIWIGRLSFDFVRRGGANGGEYLQKSTKRERGNRHCHGSGMVFEGRFEKGM